MTLSAFVVEVRRLPFGCSGGDLSGMECIGCQGYDNCWIYDNNEEKKPGVSLWSDLSGIRSVPFTSSEFFLRPSPCIVHLQA